MIFRASPLGKTHRLEGQKSSALRLARGRLMFITLLFVMAYMIVGLRIIDLALVQGEFAHHFQVAESLEEKNVEFAKKRRGNIYDRHGVLLATSLGMTSLYADPKLIHAPEETAIALRSIFPEVNFSDLREKLDSHRRFVWLKRNILPEQQEKILAIGEPGLGFQTEDRRIYPHGRITSHILGYTNVDTSGLAGMERGLEETLAKEDAALTIDVRLQHTLHQEIQASINEFDAIGGAGVILDAKTGEILAAVSLPDFDPHYIENARSHQIFNRLTLGVYELGSIFKIFSTAALLDQGKGRLSTQYDATQPLKVGRYTINDYHAQKRVMTLPEVFMHSSNIGTALMAKEIGHVALQQFYADLGLLDPLDSHYPEIGRPLQPKRWGEIETMTAAYGHGVATTPLQLASAVASIVNGGTFIKPTFVPQNNQNNVTNLSIISPKTSANIRKLLRLVVAEGTAEKADVPGYHVGGKTGTAEKPGVSKKGYDRKRLISSFVGVFPIQDPDYVVLVSIDEPKGQEHTFGYATAGWVAAPAVARVISSMASILDIPPDMNETVKDYAAPLKKYVSFQERS